MEGVSSARAFVGYLQQERRQLSFSVMDNMTGSMNHSVLNNS